jgi:hypothetical protein
MIKLRSRVLALIVLVLSGAATGQDLSTTAGGYLPRPGGTLSTVGDSEGRCGGTSTCPCFAALSVPPLEHTLNFEELPILASDDLTLAPVDGNAAAPDAAAAGGAEIDPSTLAKQANNPIANLISVPVENDWDFGLGPAYATRYLANIQPVIPFSLNEDWNLITRTIIPVIDRQALVNSPNAPANLRQNQSGLGDIEQSFCGGPGVFAPIGEVGMKSTPGPVRASRTDRRSDRSRP